MNKTNVATPALPRGPRRLEEVTNAARERGGPGGKSAEISGGDDGSEKLQKFHPDFRIFPRNGIALLKECARRGSAGAPCPLFHALSHVAALDCAGALKHMGLGTRT